MKFPLWFFQQDPRTLRWLGVCAGLLSAGCAAAMGIVIHDLRGVWAPQSLLLMRSLMLVLALLPLVIRRIPQYFTIRSWPLHLRGILGAVALYMYFVMLQRTEVALANAVMGLAPIIVIVLGAMVLREPMHRHQIIAGCVVVLAASLLNLPSVAGVAPELFLFGVVAATVTALAFLSLRVAAKQFAVSDIIFTLGVYSILLCLLLENDLGRIPSGLGDARIWLLFGLSVAVQILLTLSYRWLNAAVAVVVNEAVTLWAALFAASFGRYFASTNELLIYGVILLGIYYCQDPRRTVIDAR